MRPCDWSPEERLRAVNEAADRDEAKLGEYQRQRGPHLTTLSELRALIPRALAPEPSRPASAKAKDSAGGPVGEDRREGPKSPPPNKLDEEKRRRVQAVLLERRSC
jgi:hypothetical protein